MKDKEREDKQEGELRQGRKNRERVKGKGKCEKKVKASGKI